MPHFFDPKNLTTEQQNRWNWAVVEYRRVQEQNIERRITSMSQREKSALLKTCPDTSDPKLTVDQRIHAILTRNNCLIGGKAGDPKSALFARLLEGKEALPEPPPTSYSYPWYSVIEDKGPHPVSLGRPIQLGSAIDGTRDPRWLFGLTIKQCNWAVLDLNKSAQTLLVLDSTLNSLGQSCNGKQVGHDGFLWPEDMFESVMDAYGNKPEFKVQYGNWPRYRLNLGRRDSIMTRRDALSKQSPKDLLHCGSVFDLDYFRLDIKIGEVIVKAEHPSVAIDRARENIEQMKAGDQSNFFLDMEITELEAQHANLEADIAAYELDPDAGDTVEISCLGWQIEKENNAVETD